MQTTLTTLALLANADSGAQTLRLLAELEGPAATAGQEAAFLEALMRAAAEIAPEPLVAAGATGLPLPTGPEIAANALRGDLAASLLAGPTRQAPGAAPIATEAETPTLLERLRAGPASGPARELADGPGATTAAEAAPDLADALDRSRGARGARGDAGPGELPQEVGRETAPAAADRAREAARGNLDPRTGIELQRDEQQLAERLRRMLEPAELRNPRPVAGGERGDAPTRAESAPTLARAEARGLESLPSSPGEDGRLSDRRDGQEPGSGAGANQAAGQPTRPPSGGFAATLAPVLADPAGVATRSPEESAAAPSTRALPELPAANEAEMVRQAQILVRREGGEARIQLQPPQLGSLELRVSVSEGHVKLDMLADRAAVADLLSRHAPELRAAFESAGISLERLQVEARTDGRQSSDAHDPRDAGDASDAQPGPEREHGRRDEERGGGGYGSSGEQRTPSRGSSAADAVEIWI